MIESSRGGYIDKMTPFLTLKEAVDALIKDAEDSHYFEENEEAREPLRKEMTEKGDTVEGASYEDSGTTMTIMPLVVPHDPY